MSADKEFTEENIKNDSQEWAKGPYWSQTRNQRKRYRKKYNKAYKNFRCN